MMVMSISARHAMMSLLPRMGNEYVGAMVRVLSSLAGAFSQGYDLRFLPSA